MSERDKEPVNIFQLMEKTLSQMNDRLDDIEKRLRRLEGQPVFDSQQQDRQTIFNETHIPDKLGQLGGKSLSTSPSGGVEREIRIPVCDVCGRHLGNDFVVCRVCRRKFCPGCAIRFRGTNICMECLRTHIPLTKKAFKVLVCIANGITKTNEISEFTRIVKKEVKTVLAELKALGLVVKRGFSIFSSLRATDDSIEVIFSYSQAYGEDPDVQLFRDELRKYIEENPTRFKHPVFWKEKVEF